MEKQYKDIIEFAVDRELNAYDFYTGAQKRARTSGAKSMLQELAAQELKHKQRLEALHLEENVMLDLSKLDIADYTDSESIETDMQYHLEYQQILLIALRREKSSVRLYTDIKSLMKEKEKQQLFEWLVKEEQSHYDRLQKEYDTYVLTEN
ncbi:MAG: ferritin family protein [Deltaproteobacteria bacterium]|nr:ferritin family protein [Deltaproteobacteria bacterium]